jgi:biotin carboxyl carrier protein
MIFALLESAGTREVAIDKDDGAYLLRDGQDPTLAVDACQVAPGRWSLLVGEASHEARVHRDGNGYRVEIAGRTFTFALTDPARAVLGAATGGAHGPGRIMAPMPGRMLRILVAVGQQVRHGDPVAVVEAMKMENELTAPRDGVVTEILVAEGDTVEGGTPLVVIGEAQPAPG